MDTIARNPDGSVVLHKQVFDDLFDTATDEEILAQPCVARLHDLVRHQREALHDAGLITDAEYAALTGDHTAVRRLETYDEVCAECEKWRVAASVLCGEHIGKAQDACPVCTLTESQRAFVIGLKATQEAGDAQLTVARERAFAAEVALTTARKETLRLREILAPFSVFGAVSHFVPSEDDDTINTMCGVTITAGDWRRAAEVTPPEPAASRPGEEPEKG